MRPEESPPPAWRCWPSRSVSASWLQPAVTMTTTPPATDEGGNGGTDEPRLGFDQHLRLVDRRTESVRWSAELFGAMWSRGRQRRRRGPGHRRRLPAVCAGETDISDASRAISDEEIALCEEGRRVRRAQGGRRRYCRADPRQNALTCLTFGDLYALVGPESTGFANWTDAQALATELGSTSQFPDASLDITAPGTESGTYDSFIEIALADIAEERGQGGDHPPRLHRHGRRQRHHPTSRARHRARLGRLRLRRPGWRGGHDIAITAGRGDCVDPRDTIARRVPDLPLFIYVNTAKAAENPGWRRTSTSTSEGLATAVNEGIRAPHRGPRPRRRRLGVRRPA